MLSNSHDFIRPADEAERIFLESLIRADYDRCHSGEDFDDMKRRMPYSREDQGIYRDWMVIAAARAEALRAVEPIRAAA